MLGRVWVRQAASGWTEADVVQQLDSGRLQLRLADGAHFTAASSDVRAKNAAGMDAPEALEELEHIDDPNVLHAVRTRFKAGKFYTWADHILLSTASGAAVTVSGPLEQAREFPPDTACSLTQKLLTRMSTREEPQLVLVSDGGIGGGTVGSLSEATALCLSLASTQHSTAGPPALAELIGAARNVMFALLGVKHGKGMTACMITSFEFLDVDSEWCLASAGLSCALTDSISVPTIEIDAAGLRALGLDKDDIERLQRVASGLRGLAKLQLPGHNRACTSQEETDVADGDGDGDADAQSTEGKSTQESLGDCLNANCRAVATALGVEQAGGAEDAAGDVIKALENLLGYPVAGVHAADAGGVGLDGALAAAVGAVMGFWLPANSSDDDDLVKQMEACRLDVLVSPGDASKQARHSTALHSTAERVSALAVLLPVDMYGKLQEYVSARINAALRTGTRSARARSQGVSLARRCILVGEAPSTSSLSVTEDSGGLSDLLASLVHDLVMHRMCNLATNVHAECVRQGVPCPGAARDSTARCAAGGLVGGLAACGGAIVQGLLDALEQLLTLPTAASISDGDNSRRHKDEEPACSPGIRSDSAAERCALRTLQSLAAASNGYLSLVGPLRAGEPAWNDLCWSATASALSVGHVRAPRSYQIARLLRDAARVRGGLMPASRVLAGLARVLRLCGGLVEGGGEAGPDSDALDQGGGGVFVIQCLSPNSGGSPLFFDNALIHTQLRACGVVGAAEAGRRVLPVRVRHSSFCDRYLCLLLGPGGIPGGHALRDALGDVATADSERVQAVFEHVSAPLAQWRIGRSLVFMHDDLQRRLEQLRRALVLQEGPNGIAAASEQYQAPVNASSSEEEDEREREREKAVEALGLVRYKQEVEARRKREREELAEVRAAACAFKAEASSRAAELAESQQRVRQLLEKLDQEEHRRVVAEKDLSGLAAKTQTLEREYIEARASAMAAMAAREEDGAREAREQASAQKEREREADRERERASEQEVKRELDRLIVGVLGELACVRGEMEAATVAVRQVSERDRELIARESSHVQALGEETARTAAAAAEKQRLEDQCKEVLAAAEKERVAKEALQADLEVANDRCARLEEDIKCEREGKAGRSIGSGQDETGAVGLERRERQHEGDALEAVLEDPVAEEEVVLTPGPTLASHASHETPLPSMDAVWECLHPPSRVPVSHHTTAVDSGGRQAQAWFPGPSGSDVVIKPKGAAAWHIVRGASLENAQDALAKEKALVRRTLQIVAALQQLPPCAALSRGETAKAWPAASESPAPESLGASPLRDKENSAAKVGRDGGPAACSEEAVSTAAKAAGDTPTQARWGVVRRLVRGDESERGVGTPFKKENVLNRLSELRNSMLKSATPPR